MGLTSRRRSHGTCSPNLLRSLQPHYLRTTAHCFKSDSQTPQAEETPLINFRIFRTLYNVRRVVGIQDVFIQKGALSSAVFPVTTLNSQLLCLLPPHYPNPLPLSLFTLKPLERGVHIHCPQLPMFVPVKPWPPPFPQTCFREDNQ